MQTVKWLQVLLLYTSHKLTSVICLYTKFLLFDPFIGPYQVLLHWGRVDLGVMAMKGYSTFPKSPRLASQSEGLMSYARHSWEGFLLVYRDAVGVFYRTPSRLGCGIAANVLVCDIVVWKFEILLHYYVHFWTTTFGKGVDTLFLPSYLLNSTTTVLLQE